MSSFIASMHSRSPSSTRAREGGAGGAGGAGAGGGRTRGGGGGRRRRSMQERRIRRRPSILARISRLKLIGRGQFGSVYLAKDPATGDRYAVKSIPVDVLANASNVRDLYSNRRTSSSSKTGRKKKKKKKKKDPVHSLQVEIDLIKQLQHPHIVQYLGTRRDSESLSLFMEYMQGGSLRSHLQLYGALSDDEVLSYCV